MNVFDKKNIKTLVAVTALTIFLLPYQNFDFGVGMNEDGSYSDVDGGKLGGEDGYDIDAAMDLGRWGVASSDGSFQVAAALSIKERLAAQRAISEGKPRDPSRSVMTPMGGTQAERDRAREKAREDAEKAQKDRKSEAMPADGVERQVASLATMSGRLLSPSSLSKVLRQLQEGFNIRDGVIDNVDAVNAVIHGIGLAVSIEKTSNSKLYRIAYSSDLLTLDIDPNSEEIVKHLTSVIEDSALRCWISRLGLFNVTVYVVNDAATSFYLPALDVIILSKQEVDREGVAVFYHELLHAGLEKALRAEIIKEENAYSRLSNLNLELFGKFDGYIGNAQGYFEEIGFGRQEAFVTGWSYGKIKRKLNTIKDLDQRQKAANYIKAIESNELLEVLDDGREMRLIASNLDEVNINSFLDQFYNLYTDARRIVTFTQQKVSAELPNLCAPGKEDVINRGNCWSGQGGSFFSKRVCGQNYHWGEWFRYDTCDGNTSSGGE